MPTLRLHDAASVDEVVTFAAPLEPAATRLLAEVTRYGLDAPNRVLVADGPDGLNGVLVLTRRCADRWHAGVAVTDAEAGPLLAGAIDRSAARLVYGTPHHLRHVLGHMRRQGDVVTQPFHWSTEPVAGAELDPRVRLATPDDLDVLMAIYDGFEEREIPTRPRLRRFLQLALVETDVLVAEVDGQPAGAMRCDWATSTFSLWWAQTVLPAYRGLGLGNALFFSAMAVDAERGRRPCAVFGASNPIRVLEGQSWDHVRDQTEDHREAEWMTARLGPRRSSLPVRAARWAWESAEGRVAKRQ